MDLGDVYDFSDSASRDHTLKVWDARTGQETLTLRGHTRHVSSVAFSPDGKLIVSGSHDGALKIWDASKSAPPPAEKK